MPYLIGVKGVLAGRTIPIKHASVLGRAFDSNIRIDDLTISRHHAKIIETSRGCVIADLGSTHGTTNAYARARFSRMATIYG